MDENPYKLPKYLGCFIGWVGRAVAAWLAGVAGCLAYDMVIGMLVLAPLNSGVLQWDLYYGSVHLEFPAVALYAMVVSAIPRRRLSWQFRACVAFGFAVSGGFLIGWVYAAISQEPTCYLIAGTVGGLVLGTLLAVGVYVGSHLRPREQVGQFSIRSLMLLILAFAIILACMTIRRKQEEDGLQKIRDGAEMIRQQADGY